MKKYNLYKDSGVEWIGEIPNHWGISKYKYNLTILSGFPFKSELFDNEVGFPLLRIRDITSGEIETFYKGDFDKNYVVKKGDVVIGMDGDFNIRKWDNDDILLNQRCCKINNYKKLLLDLIFYTLPFDLKVINDLTYYTTVKHLSVTDITNITCVLPPFPEQHQIVKYLDEKTTIIDTLIEKTQQKIDTLKELRSSLINKVVTKGLDPNVEMKDSGVEWIGEIPKHWNVSKVKYTTEIFGRIGYRGYTIEDIVNEGEGVVTISPSNIQNDIFTLETSVTYLSYEKYLQSPEIMIFPDDILLVKTGSTIGKTSIVPKNVPEMTINPQLVVLKNIKINNNFFYYQTICNFFKLSFWVEQTGSTTPTISQEKINNFPILITTDFEQQQIIEYLDEQTQLIDTSIEKEQLRIEKLKEYRQSLISDVVTGKIKVTDNE